MPLGRDKFSGFIEIYWNLLKSIEIYWNILKYIEIYWNLLDLDSLDFQFPTAFWISDSTDSKFRGLLLPMPAKKATSKDAGAVDWFLPWKVGFASNVTNTWEKNSDQPLHFTMVLTHLLPLITASASLSAGGEASCGAVRESKTCVLWVYVYQ
jgi:hypothetical protein